MRKPMLILPICFFLVWLFGMFFLWLAINSMRSVPALDIKVVPTRDGYETTYYNRQKSMKAKKKPLVYSPVTPAPVLKDKL